MNASGKSDYYSYSDSDDDMKFKKLGSIFNSIKLEAKPLLTTIASEARTRSTGLVNTTKTKLADGGYINRPPPPPPRSRSVDDSHPRQEFANTKDNSNSQTLDLIIDTDGNSVLDVPANSELTLYPSYTLRKASDEYHVEVRGWLTCPGEMSRKNRILFSLAKQLIKPGAPKKLAEAVASNFVPQASGHATYNHDQSTGNLIDLDDLFSIRSGSSGGSIGSSSSLFYDPEKTPKNEKPEDVLRARMAYFFARSLTDVPINITVCSEKQSDPSELVTKSLRTDLNGKFEILIKTNYKPSLVQCIVKGSSTPVFKFQEIIYIEPRGVSVISDIDDTIKETEVLADKRTVFNNVFVRDFNEVGIQGTSELYNRLYQRNCLFHFVSNSPWQLYPTIQKFFDYMGFPKGSIHLKQYTGNILSSLMEPAVERKRQTLYKIFEEFPERKFILIGDSGEQDLEAYHNIAKKFTSQVSIICIRVVPGSLSEFNDMKVLRESRRMVNIRDEKFSFMKANNLDYDDSPETSEDEMDQPNYDWNILSHEPLKTVKKPPLAASKPAAIRLKVSEYQLKDAREIKKPPPQVPKKPSSLLAPSVASLLSNEAMEPPEKKPKLPQRPKDRKDLQLIALSKETPTKLSPRSTSSTLSAQHSYDPRIVKHSATDAGIVTSSSASATHVSDRVAEAWLQRLSVVLEDLPESVTLKFWVSPEDITDDLLAIAEDFK